MKCGLFVTMCKAFQLTIEKISPHPQKVMWWDCKGVLYYESLLRNQIKFCLDQLKATVREKHLELIKRMDVIFHHNNARPQFFGDIHPIAIFIRYCPFGLHIWILILKKMNSLEEYRNYLKQFVLLIILQTLGRLELGG